MGIHQARAQAAIDLLRQDPSCCRSPPHGAQEIRWSRCSCPLPEVLQMNGEPISRSSLRHGTLCLCVSRLVTLLAFSCLLSPDLLLTLFGEGQVLTDNRTVSSCGLTRGNKTSN